MLDFGKLTPTLEVTLGVILTLEGPATGLFPLALDLILDWSLEVAMSRLTSGVFGR